jgi:hypothetical protein
MHRIGIFLLSLFLLACDAPVTSADGFRLDIEGFELRERVKALAAQDLMAGESGYITAYTDNFCRSPDSTVQLLGRTLLTEPSEYGYRWDITIEADGSVSLTYQVGTEQADSHADLVRALMWISYAEFCETLMDRIRVEDSLLLRVSSINGTGAISTLAEDIATLRPGPAVKPVGSDPLKQAQQELDEARWKESDVQRENPWLFKQTTSYEDGSPVFEVANPSIEKNPNQSDTAAFLVIRCELGVLTIGIGRPELVFAPDFMWVSYRIGNGKAKSRLWPNVRYKGLGLWNSDEAIPFVRSLIDKDRLLIDVRVDKKETLRLTFELHKLRKYIHLLAQDCNWVVPLPE